MIIKRTLSPVGADIRFIDLLNGVTGLFFVKAGLEKLESEIKEYFGVKHLFLVSSGKAALALTLLALKSLSKRREVLIPAYTCFSVPSAVVKAGLKISLCDVDGSTFDFDYGQLENIMDEDTLCVIPTHLFGIPSDMDRLRDLCRSRGIYVVEDAAQAMGGLYKGEKLGTLGDVGFFSLGRGKNITCGSGGVIITNSEGIAEAIEKSYAKLKEPGFFETLTSYFEVAAMSLFIHPVLYRFPAGMPLLKLGQTLFYKDFPIKRLGGMKAGLLQYWRDRLEQSNRVRRETAADFNARLCLEASKPAIPYLRLPVLVESREKRDRIFHASQKRGLGLSPMYPTAISGIEEIRENFNGQTFPSAGKIADGLLTIPTHQFVSEKDKQAICDLFQGNLDISGDTSIGTT